MCEGRVSREELGAVKCDVGAKPKNNRNKWNLWNIKYDKSDATCSAPASFTSQFKPRWDRMSARAGGGGEMICRGF